ncbi:MAG: hypothetical protein JNM70_05190 [Anaerolineae bacterium]|nr:hypothetical protein [Anaerolineae bacterium]
MSRRAWWIVLAVGGVLAAAALIGWLTSPERALVEAQGRWEAAAIGDYRIVVFWDRELLDCEQDFEVRGGAVSYRHKDTCTIGPGAVGRTPSLPTVEFLFERVETTLHEPICGQNGCICDGPIETQVEYDPARGYPARIQTVLRPDWRWRDPAFWLAGVRGDLAACSPTVFIGQTIQVISLEPLQPEKPDKSEKQPGGIEGLPHETATPTAAPP